MGKNVITTNLYHKVMSIVKNIVGENATGLYISEEVPYGDIAPEEGDIVTNFDEQTSFMPDDLITDDIDIDMGVTKLVLMPKNFNYVIKIPFTGIYANVYEMANNSIHYSLVSLADGDICAEENSIYEEVSELSASLLEPNTFVGLYNDRLPIYIQRKVATVANSDSIKLISNNSMAGSKRIADYLYQRGERMLDKTYLAIMVRTYGIQTTCNIYKELGSLISDLHGRNYGRRRDGTVALFDYGGYDSSRWSRDFWEGI